MIKLFLFFVLVGALVINDSHAQEPAPQKHALIIAVGKYDEKTTGWWNLSSKADAKLIYKTLVEIKFEPENIDTLIDEKATKEGVLESLEALERKIKPGDIVIVHYSGHGQQLDDNNGDEEDKKDECLVLYGAKNPKKRDNPKCDGYLRDDEFGAALDKIRVKIGQNGHLLVIMDSCHSGSGSRDFNDQVSRGDHPYGDNTTQTSQKEEIGFGIVTGTKTNESLPNICKFVFISAANADERAIQTVDEDQKPIGSLSYAFSRALLNRSDNETYESLFASIQSDIKSWGLKQKPTLEGDSEYAIFGGKYERQKSFFKIQKIETDSIIKLKGGTLVGLYPGTEVAVVTAGKSFKDEYIKATGTIKKADKFEAEVELTKRFPFEDNTEAAWVYVTKQSFSKQKLGVDLSKLKDKNIKERLAGAIKNSTLLEFRSRGTLTVEQLKNKLLIKSKTLDRTLYSVLVINPDSVITALEEYARTRILMDAKVSDDDYLITVRLHTVKQDKGMNVAGDLIERKKSDGSIAVKLSQSIVLEVMNKRDRNTYFNILFLKENGETRVIAPWINKNGSCEENTSSFKLEPYDSMIVDRKLTFRSIEDAGMFKVIATSEPVNLCKTLQRRSSLGTRSSNNAFEEAFYKIGNNENAGISTRSVGSIEATIFDLVITLTKDK